MSGHIAGAWILRHQVPESLERRGGRQHPEPAPVRARRAATIAALFRRAVVRRARRARPSTTGSRSVVS